MSRLPAPRQTRETPIAKIARYRPGEFHARDRDAAPRPQSRSGAFTRRH